jgi:hypothetical protein
MSAPDTPRRLRGTALEAVRLIARDLTDPAFSGGLSSEVELARFTALANWAQVGRTLAAGEWSEEELAVLVERCSGRFDTCAHLGAA